MVVMGGRRNWEWVYHMWYTYTISQIITNRVGRGGGGGKIGGVSIQVPPVK